MKGFLDMLKWQLMIFQKNNIISISIAVTLFYAAILWAVRSSGSLEKVLTVIVLNDPSTIGYFFVGLAIATEYKTGVLSALMVSPMNHHGYLLSKIIAMSIIGWICALGIAFGSVGFDFNILKFSIGVIIICLISAALGIILVSFTMEFLKFALFSIPIFILFVNVPLVDYLNLTAMGWIKFIIPIQSGLHLIGNSYGNEYTFSGIDLLSIILGVLWFIIFYYWAFRRFENNIVKQ